MKAAHINTMEINYFRYLDIRVFADFSCLKGIFLLQVILTPTPMDIIFVLLSLLLLLFLF